jgi:hypothetical protein
MTSLITIFVLLIIGYLVLYFGGRKYLETFQESEYKKQRFQPDGEPNDRMNMTAIPPEKPYLMNPIDSLDDYEASVIFQNQGSKEASKKQISDAMTRYPMDWTVQGPNSQYFQENQEDYNKQLQENANKPPVTSFYKEVDGSDMKMPDYDKQEEEERKILQTYKPKCTKDLLEYNVDDVKSLVDKVFDKKGLIPVLERSKQGSNVWEIIEVKEKNPKIVWEDDIENQTQRETMEKRGEDVIEVPYTASDLAAGLDPFFQPRNSVRDGKYDYTQWTPGLERMFAPTYPVKAWN